MNDPVTKLTHDLIANILRPLATRLDQESRTPTAERNRPPNRPDESTVDLPAESTSVPGRRICGGRRQFEQGIGWSPTLRLRTRRLFFLCATPGYLGTIAVGKSAHLVAGERNATLRLHYPLMVAAAGPCGLWPDDLGPSYDTKHFENRQYYNFGCATQRNLASMAAEPADLVQPRAEGPAYTAKRTFGIDKWRKGDSPATTYPDATKGAISDVGK